MEREREKEGEERERKILLPFFPMNFNAQHWSPSRFLGSHLLEKKSREECSALQSAAARGDVSCWCVSVCVGEKCLLGCVTGGGMWRGGCTGCMRLHCVVLGEA